jgi:hypothetical protein
VRVLTEGLVIAAPPLFVSTSATGAKSQRTFVAMEARLAELCTWRTRFVSKLDPSPI